MPANADQSARHSVVLLGASNLTRSIAVASRTARALVGSPCDLALVLGHGRSYGTWSNIFGRSLPAILDCELWPALQQLDNRNDADSNPSNARRCALITDVGNDLAYGRLPTQIINWLDETIARLKKHRYTIVMTALPLASLRSMSRGRFEFIRRLFFPTYPMSFETALARIDELDALMRELARRENIRFVEQDGNWFGIDPIHIRRRQYPQAWSHFMSHWLDEHQRAALNGALADVVSIPTWWSLRLAVPAHRRIFGIQQRRAQPARRWPDGTRVSLY